MPWGNEGQRWGSGKGCHKVCMEEAVTMLLEGVPRLDGREVDELWFTPRGEL